ncbi:ABC transporter ATP-binding protein [Lysinibacillus fusiformis]|jgi:ATP-binding cassette subfamily B protein|uniref:Multidrug ABC transporter permease/ATP-binding protein n=1 Tax=Lysinibacillus fusiformis TaxID=28031 RepID=A0A1E4R8I8_9BACI|nr:MULTISPECIES: ABC transporter ATP-binding protein [Lysinibacillus]EAZ84982.1 multidrug ABC transporter, ATP-binding protein and permease [Bacillus sp. B14905]AJK87469.1 multidrug ABC transporter ATP-binding protein [Lysinibacillus fusiformis]KEK12570.1 multidrug ABC transporter ATP-binding protein [Lysinibacillus sphaericus]KGA80817.1 multidrug ABC transporter ATP-binding protein [Lysinibacillus fusiformis]KHK53122.1 multidrug ABC transporter ATP-binding protein [Lysinibacillus sp. A1]
MFDVLSKLGWFFKRYWKQYTVAIVLLMIASGLEVVPPYLLGSIIDILTAGEMTPAILTKYVFIFVGIIIGGYLLNFVWQFRLFEGAINLEKILRRNLMQHFLRMTPTFYEKNRTGDLMARATNDLNAVSTTAGFGIMTLIDSTIYMGFIIFAMGYMISWKLTLFAMLPVPIMAILIQYLGKIVHERYMKAQDSFGELNDSVLESVAGVRVVRAYVQEKKDEANFADMSEIVYEKNIHTAKINALFGPITKVGTGISYVVALGYGAHLVATEAMTVGQLVTFNVYLGLAVWPIFAIGELINVMQQGNASLDRVQETLNYEADVQNIPNPQMIATPKAIGFDDLTFQYPMSQVKNLQQVSLSLKKGQTLGIVGKTGAGKTTFLRQLLREYPIGQGQLSIDGIDITAQTKEQILDWIGYVPQDHVLFSRTIRENILFGKEDATQAELQQAIRAAYFEKDLENLSMGLETLVGEKGVSLSGGQKQRVSIARALIKDPEILMLDDSLSAVDAKTEARIIENIQRERDGKTTIITTHRLSGIQHADIIIVLDDGQVVEQGTHEELLSRQGWYKEQFDRQQLEGGAS